MITAPDFEKKQVVFVFFNEGEKMSILNDNFVIRREDGSIKLQCTCYRLFLVFAVGNFSITSAVIQRAKKFGFFIACMTAGFHVYSIIGAVKDGNTLLKKRQYEYSDNDIGVHIIKNKIKNQRDILMLNRNKTDDIKESIYKIDKYLSLLNCGMTLSEIMAYEGLSAKIYFRSHFDNVLWNGRKPRLKQDYVNSALDVGYSILFTFIDCLVECYGFDTYVGVLHRQFYMRKSLVCDLVEPFRVIIDVQVKKGINLKQIKSDDFKIINNQYKLKYDKSAKYVKFFMDAIINEKDRIFGYIQSYYISFMKGLFADDFPFFSIRGENFDNNKL